MVGYVIVWGVFFGLATLTNKWLKRPASYPAAFATIAIAIVWVCDVALAVVLLGKFNITDGFTQGRLVAQPFFSGFAGVIVGFLVWRDAKKKEADSAQPPIKNV